MDLKCGEIFLSENRHLILFCTLCEIKYEEFQAYTDHIMEKHFLVDIVESVEHSNINDMESEYCEEKQLEEYNKEVKLESEYQIFEEIELLEPNGNAENTENEEQYQVFTITDYDCKEMPKSDPVFDDVRTALSIRDCIYNCNKKPSKPNRKRFRCWECDREFYSRIGYRKHVNQHTGERKYSCNRGGCTESFISLDACKKHMDHCTFERIPFEAECNKCGMHFSNKESFEKHTKAHIQQFKCKKCHVNLKTHRGLERHMQSHAAEKQEIICQLCSTTFIDQTSLFNHLRTRHSGASQVKVYIRQV